MTESTTITTRTITTTMTTIGPATQADVPAAARTLAGAFQRDPVFTWMVPDEDRRRTNLPAVFAAFTEFYLDHEEAYVTPGGRGVALWAPPGVPSIAPGREEEFEGRLLDAMGDDAVRADQYEELAARHHPETPCFYLQFIGVEPGRQGRGLGSRLMRTVLDRCDEAGIPAYLEATSPDNRRLYARHGFEVMAEDRLPGGPPVWPMWREPSSIGTS